MVTASPLSLVDGLKAKALCETTQPAEAVVALLRAATEILCVRFDAPEVGGIIVEVVSEALAMSAPAGRA